MNRKLKAIHQYSSVQEHLKVCCGKKSKNRGRMRQEDLVEDYIYHLSDKTEHLFMAPKQPSALLNRNRV